MKSILALLCLVAAIEAVPLLQQVPSPRIIGGDVVRPAQYPFVVAIYLETDDGQYFCTGSLISNQWILTSAACVEGVNVFTLQLGSTTLTNDDPNRLIVATVNSVTHPRYNSETNENAVGLIKLHLPITFNEHIRSVSLATQQLRDSVIVTAIGWGQTSDMGSGIVNDLNAVSLTTLTNDDCKLTYGDLILDSFVCVSGNLYEGTCNGDTGGPLIHIERSGVPVHVGIATFRSANGCETIDPSGFTRTYSHHDWIREIAGV